MCKFGERTLKPQISGVKGKCLDLLFWNIHGKNSKLIGDKFLEREFLEVCSRCDILAIAELHSDKSAHVNGFKLIKQKIRKKVHKGPKISGGLAVFAKIIISHMVNYVKNTHEDSIWVRIRKEVFGGGRDIYIGTSYISPAKTMDKNVSLEKLFQEAQQFNELGLVVLQGDLNARTGNSIDYISYDKIDKSFGIENYDKPLSRNSEDKHTCPRGSCLLDLCKSLDFIVVNGRTPGDIFGKYTSFQWNGSSVVDYLIMPTIYFDKILSMKVGEFYPWLSDHCPLLYSISLDKEINSSVKENALNKLPPNFKWSTLNKTKFEAALISVPTKKVFESIINDATEESPHNYISQVTEVLLNCAYKCGLKKSTTRKKIAYDLPWFDQECRRMKNDIRILAKNIKRFPNENKIRIELFTKKRKFSHLVRKKKTSYKLSILKEMHLTSKKEIRKYWRLVDKISPTFTKKNTITTENINVKDWITHFKSVFLSKNNSLPKNIEKEGPLDYNITLKEMISASHILRSGKSPGLDNITNEMINSALHLYQETFLYLFNHILQNGGHVPGWSLSILVPIHKKGSLDDPNNYRGIALTSCLSKLYFTIIKNRLFDYCMEKGIISQQQLGFLPGNRTSDAHIILHNLISKYCHKKQNNMYGCFVDFSKAFDSISREKLLQKLLGYGVTGKVYDSIKHLYEEDRTFLKIGCEISEEIKVDKGVRQGCIMSPLLFNIFMADLPDKFSKNDNVSLDDSQKIKCIIWADDILLLSETENGLTNMLECLNHYCNINELVINADKTKCMVFNKSGHLFRKKFILGSKKIETVRSYKYLGLVFTPSGEINSALNDLRSRALKAYMSLKHKLSDCFMADIEETITLWDTLVKPIMMYSSDFWGCLKLPVNNPIENLHMHFCKNILGVHKSTTNIGVLLEVGRVPIIFSSQKAAIKNWERIRSNKANKLVYASYKGAKAESLRWHQGIKSCLEKNGMMQYFIENKPPFTFNVCQKIHGRLVDQFHQTAFSQIKLCNSKLRTYGLVKDTIGMEYYLKSIRNTKRRTELTKLRLSNHKLMIEVGRHQNIPKTLRLCPFCPQSVEDEKHFLISCSNYINLRHSLIEECLNLEPTFVHFNEEDKFIFIMSRKEILPNLVKFVSLAMEYRINEFNI